MLAKGTNEVAGQQAMDKEALLRRALRANAAFSMVSGIGFIVGAGAVDRFIGLGSPLAVGIVGALLLPYAALLVMGTRGGVDRSVARTAIAGDGAWVLGSILILLLGVPELSVAGKWAVAIVADIVAMFAVAQWLGLRRLRSAS